MSESKKRGGKVTASPPEYDAVLYVDITQADDDALVDLARSMNVSKTTLTRWWLAQVREGTWTPTPPAPPKKRKP